MTTTTRPRAWFEADRACDFLAKLPDGHPLWEPTLEKVYRFAAQAEGMAEDEAKALAATLIGRWRADTVRLAARVSG